MPIDLQVTGADQLAALAAKVKEIGDKGLRRELLRDTRNAAKPLVALARSSAREHLPKEGGLNEVVASSKFGIRTRTSGRNPGVRVVGVSVHQIEDMDAGHVRHPVYPRGGDRAKWAWTSQRITPGWWTKAMQEAVPHVRSELVHSLDEYARRL